MKIQGPHPENEKFGRGIVQFADGLIFGWRSALGVSVGEVLGEYAGWALLMPVGTAALPMPGLVFLFAMFGSFLCCCFNSSAAPAADEIRVRKKRAVSDAQIAKMV